MALPPQARKVEGGTIKAVSGAVRKVLDWLEASAGDTYTTEQRMRDVAQREQLRQISLQLGGRRRPIPDLDQLRAQGRALYAGKLVVVCSGVVALFLFCCVGS